MKINLWRRVAAVGMAAGMLFTSMPVMALDEEAIAEDDFNIVAEDETEAVMAPESDDVDEDVFNDDLFADVDESEIEDELVLGIAAEETEVELQAAASTETSGTCGENVTWTLDNGTLTITGTGKMEDYKSTYAHPWNKDSVKTVIIKNGVTTIGKYAFFGCSSLTSVTIPVSVTSIEGEAFRGCSSLTSVTIPDSVTTIGDFAFSDCSSLTSVTIPDSVTSIEDGTFYCCFGLTSVTIPDGVTSIGDSAFEYCRSLTSVTIPDSVISIGAFAFEGCFSLTSVTIPGSVKYIGSLVFLDCGSLTNVTILEGLTEIGGGMFEGCSSLTSVTIPDSVTTIGGSAFSDCSSLTSITIPDGVTSIGYKTFYSCTSLTSITIPDSVTSIGNSAFYECTGLTSITIPDSVTSIGDSVFYYCTGLTSITIPDSVTSIGDSAFEKCYSLTSVTIPDGVTSIGQYTFYHCYSLTSVTIPDGVTSIGKYAFYDCSSLTSVTIPVSVTSIEGEAFRGCRSLEDIYYTGSETEWAAIQNNYNGAFTFMSLTIHYLEAGESGDTEPDASLEIEFKDGKDTYIYKGIAVIPNIVVRGYMKNEDGSKEEVDVAEGTDYTLTYKDNNIENPETDTVTATVTVNGLGDFSGRTSTIAFTILYKDVRLEIEFKDGKDTYVYKGKAVIPDVVVRGYMKNEDGTEEEVDVAEGTDYTLTYKDNNIENPETDTVTATVTVNGLGDFSGSTSTIAFTIQYKDVRLDYLEVDFGGNVTVHWFFKGEEDSISGFEVQHCWKDSVDDPDGWRTTKVSGSDKREVDIVDLSYNTYEFRVRALNKDAEDGDSEWTDWAECPVKEIKIISPEPGSSFADSLGLVGQIDFGTEIDIKKADGSGDIVDGLISVCDSNGMVKAYSDINEVSALDGLLTVNGVYLIGSLEGERASNPDKNPFIPGNTYHVSIKEKGIRYVEESEDYDVPVYFAGISETDASTWSYSTAPISYSAVKNFDASIPDEWFQLFYENQDWEDIKGRAVSSEDQKSHGFCFALAYAIGAYAKQYTGIKDISSGYQQLANVPVDDKSAFYEYLLKAQICQYQQYYMSISVKNMNKYDEIYNAIKEGDAITLRLFESPEKNRYQHGHEIFPLGIISDTNSEVKVAVYDPNTSTREEPQETFIRTLIFKKSFGKINGFEYRKGEEDFERNAITYIPIDNAIDNMVRGSIDCISGDENLVTSSVALNDLNEIIGTLGGASSNNRYLYWIDDNIYHIESIEEDATITLSDGTNKIYATLSAGQSATLDIGNKLVTIDGADAGGIAGEYKVRFSEAEDYDTFHDTVIKGTSGNADTILTKTEDGTSVETDANAIISVSTEDNDTETASTKVKLTDGSAQVRVEESGTINVYADLDGDGIYTDAEQPVDDPNDPGAGDTGIVIDETSFPDDHFREFVLSHIDTVSDGILSTSEADAVRVLEVNKNSSDSADWVTDLTGIKYFRNLEELYCGIGGSDPAFVHDENVYLLWTEGDFNYDYVPEITNLDLSCNTALVKLVCTDTALNGLDLSHNVALEELDCSYNDNLKELDLSANQVLRIARCNNNNLTNLTMGEKPKLKELYCSSNQLTSLDLTYNEALERFYCNNNQLTSLVASYYQNLKTLDCSNNQLTVLNVDNNLKLEDLDCSGNQLTVFDVYVNMSLKTLDCSNNQLTYLGVDDNLTLECLYCDNNQLPSLDIGATPKLRLLSCSNNRLTSLDLRNMYMPELEKLNCSGNQLTSLVVSDNPKLYSLSCCSNKIRLLDISKCNLLVEVYKNGTIDTGSTVYLNYSDSSGELIVDLNVEVIDAEKVTISKKPSIKKPAAAKGKITVKWSHFKHTSKKTKAIWKKIKKVQIQCATDKGFTNIVKTSMVGKSKTKYTIKGLSKKTTYYVRVRYYDGTGYSKWSGVKKVKTK